MKYLIHLSAVIIILGFVTQCTDPDADVVPISIQGTVLDRVTSDPIADAVVRLFSPDSEKVDQTDEEGSFHLTLGVDSTFDISVIISKEGYISDTTEALAVPARDISLPAIYLLTESSDVPGDTTGTPGPSPSGITGPASIEMGGVSPRSISVLEAGSSSNATITFWVLDSNGVSAGKDIQVDFSMGSSPGGGEYISPMNMKTDITGRVIANLRSGTKAGVVQVLASVDVTGTQIRSQAVPVTIHGGLPDSSHFGLAPEKWNFPGYGFWGQTNLITAFVGDKYGNYCTPNTAVYFTTDAGMIGGSGLTKDGTSSVVLISAPPLPEHPTLGKGFATITARTADNSNTQIETTINILVSGRPVISNVSVDSILVPHEGTQNISFTVTDENGHPLSKDTAVRVQLDAPTLEIVGSALSEVSGILLPDTKSPGPNVTDFSFTLSDLSTEDTKVTARVTILTVGANGATSVELLGFGY